MGTLVQRWTAFEIAETLGWQIGGRLRDPLPLGPAQIDTRAIVVPEFDPGDAHRGSVIEAVSVAEAGVAGAQPGAPIFVALQGPGGHGANFWAHAVNRGAGALLFGSDADEYLLNEVMADAIVPVLVADTDGWTALGELANAWRRRCDFTVVGITGSTGKTSTKDLLATLLAPVRRTHASPANHNNELGVPLTLLAADPDINVVICEMGMRGRRQIEYLCEVAEPDVGVLTNVGSAHLELLGSLEAIAAAKAEVIAGTRPSGTAVVPASQPGLLALAERVPQRVLTFDVADGAGDGAAGEQQPEVVINVLPSSAGSNTALADVHVVRVERSARGIAGSVRIGATERAFSLPIHGLHNARNLAAAVAVAWAILGDVGVSKLDLEPAALALSAGRGQRTSLDDGGIVIDDAYNANPESVQVALTELSAVETAGQRVAVLGYMAELGPGEIGMHITTGEHVAALQVDQLVAVTTHPAVTALVLRWEELTGQRAITFESVDAAVASLSDWATARDAILVKASNSVGLGRCAAALVERYVLRASATSLSDATAITNERGDTA
ncbi:MAG: UDP-N-acetylmuramoyl-tripeptide--D-alanyl-D-alanine ligase [Thermoleophilia bacterium]|nr:UDP-N-acetylmuramoyl-tripeptide--D-alanyl-D-alanine ligase [Thermoleophilia bacterium]